MHVQRKITQNLAVKRCHFNIRVGIIKIQPAVISPVIRQDRVGLRRKQVERHSANVCLSSANSIWEEATLMLIPVPLDFTTLLHQLWCRGKSSPSRFGSSDKIQPPPSKWNCSSFKYKCLVVTGECKSLFLVTHTCRCSLPFGGTKTGGENRIYNYTTTMHMYFLFLEYVRAHDKQQFKTINRYCEGTVEITQKKKIKWRCVN